MAPTLEDGIKWYLVFLFSTSFHEASHAWAALRLGDPTAARAGQATLDPTPHLRREPVGMVVVPLLSFFLGGWMIGWASAPFDPRWAALHPRRAAWMALAGPAANLTLVLLSALLIRAGMEWRVFEAPSTVSFDGVTQAVGSGIHLFLAKLVSIAFSLNLLLGCFNLLPLPPLDGSSLWLLVVPAGLRSRVQALLYHPQLRGIGMLAAWWAFGALFKPIQLFAVNLLYPGHGYR